MVRLGGKKPYALKYLGTKNSFGTILLKVVVEMAYIANFIHTYTMLIILAAYIFVSDVVRDPSDSMGASTANNRDLADLLQSETKHGSLYLG